MLPKNILKDEIEKAMGKNNLGPFTNLYVGWNDEKRILVIVEKRKTKSGVVYESHALKISIVDDKMQKTFSVRTTKDPEYLEVFLYQTVRDLELEFRRNDQGIVVRDPQTCLNMLMTTPEGETRSNDPSLAISQITPQPTTGRTIGYVCKLVGRDFEITNNPVLISDSMLLHHTVITGSTGGGKTEIAKRIISEINKERKTVVVLTPEPNLWASTDNVHFVKDDMMEENKVNIVDFSGITNFQEGSSKFLENLVDYYTDTEQTTNLKLLVVVDEAHQFKQEVIEKAVRILRKYGVAIILTSHTYADFNRGIRANIQTHIAMYTNWEKDISFIRQYQQKGAPDYAGLLRHVPEGYGIFRSRDFSRNMPFLCKFLTSGEVFQPSIETINDIPVDDLYARRMTILDIIKECPRISAESIQPELERKGIEVSSVTVYSDLDYLEKENLITREVKERGKRYYVAVEG